MIATVDGKPTFYVAWVSFLLVDGERIELSLSATDNGFTDRLIDHHHPVQRSRDWALISDDGCRLWI